MTIFAQLRDYNKCIDRSFEYQMAKFKEGLTWGVSVEENIGADIYETIERDSDTIEREAFENESDGDNADEVTIRPSEALECSLRRSSFLSIQHDIDELTKKLASIIEYVRNQWSMRKNWRTIVHFLEWLQIDPLY